MRKILSSYLKWINSPFVRELVFIIIGGIAGWQLSLIVSSTIWPGWEDAVKGDKALQNKDFNAAVIYYTKAIELDPNYVFANNNRGIAYHKLEKYPEALADYTKANELDPKYEKAYYNRGSEYDDLKKYPEAIAITPKLLN